jgi:hypothetical protein
MRATQERRGRVESMRVPVGYRCKCRLRSVRQTYPSSPGWLKAPPDRITYSNKNTQREESYHWSCQSSLFAQALCLDRGHCVHTSALPTADGATTSPSFLRVHREVDARRPSAPTTRDFPCGGRPSENPHRIFASDALLLSPTPVGLRKLSVHDAGVKQPLG